MQSARWSAVMMADGSMLPGGNRCGHDPRAPRWFQPPEKHAPRPAILRKLNEKLRGYYRRPGVLLPSLNGVNGSERQQRSERREACLDLLGGLVHYLDLATLRVGVPGDEGFRGIPMARLAGLSGLSLRRAERACRDLVAAGIIGEIRLPVPALGRAYPKVTTPS
ncbi:MAG: hypothetical protein H6971_10450, partial [Gammaproteobacteria bacterium]|nr:hypothetical protein [Gammaproteobacteria bacterium]